MKALTITVLFVCALTNLALAQDSSVHKIESRKGIEKQYLRNREIGVDFSAKSVSSFHPLMTWLGDYQHQSATSQMNFGLHYFMRSRHKTSLGLSLYSDGYTFWFNRSNFDRCFFSATGPISYPQVAYGPTTTVNARYLFLAPILDIACGKRNRSHFHLNPAFGRLVYVSHRDMINVSDFGVLTNPVNLLNKKVDELGLGFRHDFVLGKNWVLSLDGTVSRMISGINLSQIATCCNVSLPPTANACRFTLGVNKKPGSKH